MNEQKMRAQFEADMWRDALEEGAEPNLTRGPNGDYVQPWISGAWHGYQAATAATQRDAMAVAEAVLGRAIDAVAEDRFNGAVGAIARLDLAAIVESVRPVGEWKHCSPELLASGIDCGTTPRRACQCPHGGSHDHFVAQLPASAQQQGEPVAWIRFCSDGCYEGPIMNSVMEDVRKKSGAWTPLYTAPPAPACRVPDELDCDDAPWMSAETEPDVAYADGWNACRAAMLASAPKGGA